MEKHKAIRVEKRSHDKFCSKSELEELIKERVKRG